MHIEQLPHFLLTDTLPLAFPFHDAIVRLRIPRVELVPELLRQTNALREGDVVDDIRGAIAADARFLIGRCALCGIEGAHGSGGAGVGAL